MYKERHIDQKLNEYLKNFPAILIEGSKGVGKTKTAEKFSKTVFSLDDDNTLNLILSNPEIAINSTKPVLLDEWQFAPNIWNFIRHQVDDGLSNGSIIFTGSSIRVNHNIHSGAGRFVNLKMRPFTIQEREMSEEYISIGDFLKNDAKIKSGLETDKGLDDYLNEIYKSGFPGLRDLSDLSRKERIKSYLDNLVNHEFVENGFIIKKPQSLKQWLIAYAAVSATTTNFSKILEIAMSSNTEGISRQTANTYREALEILYIIDELPNFWYLGKLISNIAKTPKHYLMDPALVVSLLKIDKNDLLKQGYPSSIGKINHTFLGGLFESFIYQSLIVYAEYNDAELSTFRTKRGDHEIDFIIKSGRKLLLFEVKTSPLVNDDYVKNMNWFEEQVKDEFDVEKILVNTGKYAYTRPTDNVHIIPAALLGI
jgi:predicted AAA+ superfamily ATPase